MNDNTSSPLPHDAPADWEHLQTLLARQPGRPLSAEREGVMMSRVEETIGTPRPLMHRPAVRRGMLATGSAMALAATIWFTGVLDGDAPQATSPSNALPAASAPAHPRTTQRNYRRPPRTSFSVENEDIPLPTQKVPDTAVPTVPQHTTPQTGDPFAPGPGRR